jgi:polyisoprenoid-binding protein YceI
MSTTLQQIPAGTYGVDTIHSTIGFGVKHLGLSTFRSGFARYDAQLADGVLTGTAEVASIQIEQPDLKGHVLAADFLDAEASPTLTFRSTEIRAAADGSVEVDGELTIKGITKAVTATGTYAAGQDPSGTERVAFELEAVVDRRAHGLDWQSELPSGGDALGWDVTLTAHLELVAAAA